MKGFLFVDKEVAEGAAAKKCRWKKRLLMEVTIFLNNRMKALM